LRARSGLLPLFNTVGKCLLGQHDLAGVKGTLRLLPGLFRLLPGLLGRYPEVSCLPKLHASGGRPAAKDQHEGGQGTKSD